MATTIIALRRILGFAILFSLLSTAAFAQKAHKTDNGVSDEETAAFEAQVRAMINRSGDGLTVYTLDNGTKVVDLEGRFQSVALARKDSSGKVSTVCVSNQNEVKRFLKGRAAKAARKPGKTTSKSAPAAEVK